VTLTVAPFPLDLARSLDLAERALASRMSPGERTEEFWPAIASAIRTGRASGALLREGGESHGMALWEPAGPLGVAVRLLYLEPPAAGPGGYREALDAVAHAAGAVAFSTGQLAGLSEREESLVMRARGFAPFGRSELTLPPASEVASIASPPGARVRPIVPADEPVLARLHERAYENHLDRYLALEDLDPTHDADRQLREYFTGRYGEVLSPGSCLVTADDTVAAAVIATKRAQQALIIDVMSDPAYEGRGFARLALTEAVHRLRERGETKIVLNVTEGNDRALRLYSRLGFVRSMGPTREWYDAARIAVDRPAPRPA